MRLAVQHNLYFYNQLTRRIRQSLDEGRFEEFYQRYHIALGERNPD
jgi:queuine tRNA-ribosyltransferase